MNRAFRPFLSKQRQQRETITRLEAELKTTQERLEKTQKRSTNTEHLLQAELASHAMAEQTRAALQDTLKQLQGQYDTLLAKYEALGAERDKLEADLKAARYHGKKKPPTTETVIQAQS